MDSLAVLNLLIVLVIVVVFAIGRRRATAWAGLDAEIQTTRRPASAGSEHGMLEGAAMPALLVGLSLLALFLVGGHLNLSDLLWSIALGAVVGCLLAVAQACVVISGSVDLSLGGTMVLSAAVMALAAMGGMPGPLAVLAALLVGLGCGLANALLLQLTGLPPFAVTLAAGQVATGLAYGLTGGDYLTLDLYDPVVTLFGDAAAAGPLLVAAVAVGLGWRVSRSGWGQDLFSTGADADRAARAGVRVDRVRLGVYLLAGLLAALAGWLLVGRMNAVVPSMGSDGALRSLAAVVVGGVLLRGGHGSVIGAALGAVAIGIVYTVLSIVGVEPFWMSVLVPALLLVAAFVAQRSRERG